MRVAYYSVEGSSLSWMRRLVDEGCELLVYIDKEHGKYQQKCGDGYVPKTYNRDEWMRFGLSDPRTVWFFDFSGCGELADRLRITGKYVVGGGQFCDKLENDRGFGESIARQHKLLLPPSKKFATISDALAFLRKNPTQESGDGGWAWKPNRELGADASYVACDTEEMLFWLEHVALPKYGNTNPCLLQEKIDGVALSTARWWNGRAWVGPFEGTIEKKKFMNGEKGPATGCSTNLVWFYREEVPKIARALQWNALAATFAREQAPPGLYDINAIVDHRGAWYLEWTPRLGYDSELTSQRGVSSLAQLLWYVATGAGPVDELFDLDRAIMSVRVTVPPYPVAEKLIVDGKNPALGVPVRGADGLWDKHFIGVGVAKGPSGMEVVDPFAFVGLSLAVDTSLERGFKAVYDYLESGLQVANMQYRTDGAEAIAKDIKKMRESGWPTTEILEVDYA